jgi:hypothetical protein
VATYDPARDPYGPDRRARRDLDVPWSAIFGGTVVGWGVFLLLVLFGNAAGLGIPDLAPARDAALGQAMGTAAAMILSSVAGGSCVAWLAGERRSRSGRIEAVVSWALSMIGGALFALLLANASGRRAFPSASAPIAAGALLSLFGALAGATIAARRRSGRGVGFPMYFQAPARERSVPFEPYDGERDEPTILPPAH